MCAMGQGDNFSAAESSGRDHLAKIFHTRVQSHSLSQTSYQSNSKALGPNGLLEEEYSQRIQESTDFVLQGAKVQERYRDGHAHYALVSLEKSLGAKLFKQKIQAVDEEIEALYKMNRRGHTAKALKLYPLRDALAAYHLILQPLLTPPPISRKQLLNRQLKFSKMERTVYIDFNKNINSIFRDFITKEFLELHYKIATDQDKPFDFKILAQLHTKESFLNVQNFQKIQFSFNMTSLKKNGSKLGGLFLQFEETGRSKEAIMQTAIQKIMAQISQRIGELHIE